MTSKKPFALVFTDMVGSSAAKRAVELGPDASTRDRAYLAGIQARHLRLVRQNVAKYMGKEVMTIGDAFFLTFESPADAILCAAAIQQALHSDPVETGLGPMKLRIGIHVGTPEYFENSWHGTDVDTAARTESAGSPDQIVVTEAARRAIGDPPDITFRPLGTYYLKGIGDVKLWDADYDQHGIRRSLLISNEQRHRKHVTTAVATLLVAVLVVVAGLWRWHLQQQAAVLAGAAKSSIILADIDNRTGEPIFDTTLNRAMTTELEQSPVLKLVSQQHLRESMKYLGKSPDQPLTPSVIKEIGIREGSKAFLSGSLAKVGDGYLLTMRAQDISSGDDLVSEEARASNKDHVLDALDTVAKKMRSRLGETLGSIRKLDTPLAQATTPSLAAFQAYALGDMEHEKSHDIPQAENYYREAVEIDPDFAMAWARLGTISLNEGRTQQATTYLEKAYNLSKNVSERERLYIQGHYYQYDLGDLQKTITTLELATHIYPSDYSNYINLGIAYGEIGQEDKYLAEFKQARKIDPHAALPLYNIMGVQLTLDRVTAAENTMAEIERLGLDTDSTYLFREILMLDFLKGDRAGMKTALAQTQGRVDRFQMTGSLALTQEFDGRFHAAQTSWRAAEAQAAPLKANDIEAGFLLSDATGRAFLGRCGGAASQLKSALKLDRSKSTLSTAALLAALCDDSKRVFPILADLAKSYPTDTLINQVTIPQSRAVLALASHKPAEALRYLEGSQQFDLISAGAYLRGLAYLDLHDGKNAAVAFRAATQYRGAALICCQDYPVAQLGLARAYAMMGNAKAAKATYQSFFTTWKLADPDLPQLVAARKEFANLQ
jgi:class 3 adenylate cyclase/tetratricopeptide (TPR) repeat protein